MPSDSYLVGKETYDNILMSEEEYKKKYNEGKLVSVSPYIVEKIKEEKRVQKEETEKIKRLKEIEQKEISEAKRLIRSSKYNLVKFAGSTDSLVEKFLVYHMNYLCGHRSFQIEK